MASPDRTRGIHAYFTDRRSGEDRRLAWTATDARDKALLAVLDTLVVQMGAASTPANELWRWADALADIIATHRQFMTEPSRLCVTCHAPLVRKAGESRVNFTRRRFCNRQCSYANPKRP